MPSNHLILCHPLLLLPSVFPSNTVCSNESVLHISGQSIGVSASISFLPMNTQDWPPLGWTGWISLQSKGTLKSLLQHHSSKASILQCSAFFIVQLSHPYINIGSYKHIFDGQLFKSCFPFHTETTDELKKKKKIQWGFVVGLECIFRFHLLVAVVQSLSCVWFLWPHGLQHTRLLCPPLIPRVSSDSCPLSQWCYLIISSSASPFSSCLQSFPASGSFPMTWLFSSGDHSIVASASVRVLPMNIQGRFPSLSVWMDSSQLVSQGATS